MTKYIQFSINAMDFSFQALNAVRIEAQMNLSRAVIEERAQKDIAVQQALAQARADMQDKIEPITVVSADGEKVAYQVTWSGQPIVQNHIETIPVCEADDANKDKDA